ncbi:hypothetical protein BN946_scf184575.g6 [Trametes cinnabarina]|uniref:Uncharacterized protein n=1 Tax=Pycnoporus cinnabarinus TaxID=5643 RepID=A0A060S5D9_PYCCI|nr:hypothetical protein BN946_scf184575.g6 [Trametes cinnabarina]
MDAKQFEEKVTLVKEIADVLRKNVVQARKVEEASGPDEKELWELEIREDTELGSNETIKQAKKGANHPGSRVNPEDSEEPSQADPSDSESEHKIPRYYSQLKKAHKARVIPELREEDLEESFVRGAGCHLDALYNPGLSKQDLQRAKMQERERRKRKKAKKKQKQKEAVLQGEGGAVENSERGPSTHED